MLAGGTDWMVDRHLMPVAKATPVDQVIDLTHVEALSKIGFCEIDGERWLSLGRRRHLLGSSGATRACWAPIPQCSRSWRAT